MIGQLLVAWPIIAIVLGKAAIFHHGLNGCRADNKKQTLVDFSFSLSGKKPRCSRRVREWERAVVSGGGWFGGQGCFIGHLSVSSASLKKFHASWLAKHCVVLLFRQPTSLYESTVYVHIRSNMHVVSVYFCNPPNLDTDYRIFNVPTWSFNPCIYTGVCLHMFAFTYSVRLNGCLFQGGGGAGPFSLIQEEGPWAPFHEILEVTRMLELLWPSICLSICLSVHVSKFVQTISHEPLNRF